MSAIYISPEAKKKRRAREIKETVKGWLYISPVVLGLLLFTAFPTVFALVTSFFKYNDATRTFNEFVGMANYLKPFTYGTVQFTRFWQSMKVTFLFGIINIPLSMVLSFTLAFALNTKLKGMKIFRCIFYLPVLIPVVCNGLVWKNITSVDYGIGNKILTSIGLPANTWFTEVATAMPSLIFINIFAVGGGMILWIAQLKNIPDSLYESAQLDGAGFFRKIFSITIPMCTPMIFYTMVMSLISTLQTFASIQALTNGAGPQFSLLFYIMNVYDEAFNAHNLGYASALSFILMIIIGMLTLVVFKTNKWVHYGEDA